MANTNRSRRWIFSFMTGMALLLCLMTTPVFTGGVSAAGSTTEPTGKTVRVGWYESPYNRIDKYGRRSGYAYDFQQKIAAYTNWDYEYVEGSSF